MIVMEPARTGPPPEPSPGCAVGAPPQEGSKGCAVGAPAAPERSPGCAGGAPPHEGSKGCAVAAPAAPAAPDAAAKDPDASDKEDHAVDRLLQGFTVPLAVGLVVVARAVTYSNAYYLGFFSLMTLFIAIPTGVPDDARSLNVVLTASCCVYAIMAAFVSVATLSHRVRTLWDGTCAAGGTPWSYCAWNVAHWSLFITYGAAAADQCIRMTRLPYGVARDRYWHCGDRTASVTAGIIIADIVATKLATDPSSPAWLYWKLSIATEALVIARLCRGRRAAAAAEATGAKAPQAAAVARLESLESLSLVVFGVRDDGSVALWSHGAQDLTGVASVGSLDALPFFTDRDRRSASAEIARLADEEPARPFRCDLRTSNGAPAPFVFQTVRGISPDQRATFIGSPVDPRLLSLAARAGGADAASGEGSRRPDERSRRNYRDLEEFDHYSASIVSGDDSLCSALITPSLVESVRRGPSPSPRRSSSPVMPLATLRRVRDE